MQLPSRESARTFDAHSRSSLNIPNLPKNHPLIVLTNLTRQIIDKANSNGSNIHPNTTLHKILNQSNFFFNFEKHREIIGGSKGSFPKYSDIWTSIANSCQHLPKPKNPQTLPLTPNQL